jgi:two-component sensor histidine kinase
MNSGGGDEGIENQGTAVGMSPESEPPDDSPGLLRALRNTAVSVFYQDRALRVVWAQNVPAAWAAGDIVGATDKDFLPPGVAERVTAAKHAVMAAAHSDRLEISIPNVEGARWFDMWIDADHGADGQVRGIVTTAVETTEQKRREQTLRALLREVSHRSRNLLAIIQSIATQTGRYSVTIEGFLNRFRGRLQSLASSQDLVTSSNWRGADLAELVIGQVARYTPEPSSAIRFEGERPWLNPNAALHVGLALHELAVNSVSYGALSRPDGFVTVAANLSPGPPGKTSLSLTWNETIGTLHDAAPDAATRERRFGSVALERVVPASLNGTASLDIAGGKLEYRLVIPFQNFELD